MNTETKVNGLRKLRILVAPLDWGLGHTTRCIPVIYELRKLGCDVCLAGDPGQIAILKDEFPDARFLPLPGYSVHYGRNRRSMAWHLFRQQSKIFRAIREENKWLRSAIGEFQIDAVISDNRFGLYTDKVPCVFITHQLLIKSPLGGWHERYLQKKNYRFINRFDECWVPDSEGENSLAGELSNPPKKPSTPIKYLGPLSRFTAPSRRSPVKSKLLFILSGPEPQRSILEEKIINDLADYPFEATVVRGLPAAGNIIPSFQGIQFFNHLGTSHLLDEIAEAEFVISRSGYTSVMDLTGLGKKTIMIPTPGQTEQEYLGKYLSGRRMVACISQDEFTLEKAIRLAKDFPYSNPPSAPGQALTDAVGDFIHSLYSRPR